MFVLEHVVGSHVYLFCYLSGDAVHMYHICLKWNTGAYNLGFVWRKCGRRIHPTFMELNFLEVVLIFIPA
jgi:hypothetical protein